MIRSRTYLILRASFRFGVATQAKARLPGNRGKVRHPAPGLLFVYGAGQIVDDSLEILARFRRVAEAAVDVGQSAEQLAFAVCAKVFEEGLLQLEGFFVIGCGEIEHGPGASFVDKARAADQDGSPRNTGLQTVRRESYRIRHFFHTSLVQLEALLRVAYTECLTGSEIQSTAMPHHGRVILRIFRQLFFALLHGAFEARSVAIDSREEILADDHVEPLSGLLRHGEAECSGDHEFGDVPHRNPE